MRATKGQIERFFGENSMVWLDIVDELNSLARLAQVEYDIVGEPHVDDEGYKIVPNSSETLIHLGEIKGRRKAAAWFLSLPEILLQNLEVERDDSKRKPADRSGNSE